MPNRLADLPPSTSWESHGLGARRLLKEIKRAEAEERNARTAPERRRAARRVAS